jgi:hypothetical protein
LREEKIEMMSWWHHRCPTSYGILDVW